MFIKQKLVVIAVLGCAWLTDAFEIKAQSFPQPRIARQTLRVELPAPSYLGVQTENVSQENFAKYNLIEPRGVAVTSVVSGSPASEAGLKTGDVIISFEGEEVKSVFKLMRLIEEVAPDQKARLKVLRGGSEQEFVVTMDKRPLPQMGGFEMFPSGTFNSGAMAPIFSPRTRVPPPLIAPEEDTAFLVPGGASLKIGASVQTLSEQLGNYFGASGNKGLLVTEVRANGAAAKAGLKAGDVIVEVDGAGIVTRTDLIRALSNKNEGEMAIVILRDKQRQTLRIKPEANTSGVNN